MSVAEAPRNFEKIREEYNRLFQQAPIRDDDRAYQWHAMRLLQEKPGLTSVLDLACGGGYFLRELFRLTGKKASLTGTDISEAAIEIAKRECPHAAYVLTPAEGLPFGNEKFDAVTCLGSMEHFLDIEKAVSEMRRVSRKDSVFYIMVPNIFWYKDLWSVFLTGDRKTRNQTQERFASLGEWKDLLESCGLSVSKVEKYNGIARSPLKQKIKDAVIPLRFSYHFIFICSAKGYG